MTDAELIERLEKIAEKVEHIAAGLGLLVEKVDHIAAGQDPLRGRVHTGFARVNEKLDRIEELLEGKKSS